ncbi:hypothetical protein CFP65_4090 [Kitasatospora sp. MMS16-BH015]|uniref:hypothetical protein n=1 Tax=Kitasatospora sp. MMS16-BH015 TaxID=2018025 RepID=UPI000CA37DB3|nr:hypothetical protein [Kitasatospora sp. MMS16-BH015]AUG78852.1 hypothetical protein CFP65_4090 [Kitasatospora sp. MMS16-BH015]
MPAGPPSGPLVDLIRSQTGNRRGDATAYLRGAAHLNPAFRDAVIEELAENPHRIPPPSLGIDLVAVLKECFANRNWAAVRGLAMLLLPFLLLPFGGEGVLLPLILVLSVRAYLGLARWATGRLLAFAARLSDRDASRWLRRASSLVWLVVLGYLVFANLAAIAVLWDHGLTHDEIVCHPSGPEHYQDCHDEETVDPTAICRLIVLAGWVAIAGYDRYRRLHTLHALATGTAPVAPDGVGRRATRYQELRRQQADPDVVFSDYAPFVGAGVELDSWSFPIELLPQRATPKKEAEGAEDPLAKQPQAVPFTRAELHAHLRAELLRLGGHGPGQTYPGDRLHGIRVDDYVFKRGRRVGPAKDWSGTGPGTAFAELAPFAAQQAAHQLGIPADQLPGTWWYDSLDLAAEEQLRHYLATRVESWDGSVVVTVFTRAQLQGGLLFLESRAFLLPPLDRAYYAIDQIRPPKGVDGWLSVAARAVTSFLPLVATAVPDLYTTVRTANRTTRTQGWYAWMCHRDQPVDHGPTLSVRELGAEAEYQQLFQEMDVQRFVQSIELRTLTAVNRFLREHGYRTDEYEARQTTVINNGIQVNGTVNGIVQNGANTRASQQQVTPPQPRVGTADR